jgi:hypothetical protein
LTGSAFTGFGSSVPTPSLQCKRQGSDLLIKGTFQAGTTPTAVEARMSLPIWNGVQLTSASSAIIPALQLAGNVTANVNSTTFFGNYSLIEPSVTYVTFSQQASTLNGYTKALGNQIAITGTQYSIIARVPINGWNNSNIIIGQFNEVMTVPNVTKPKTCYYAFGGASATLASPTECITGTCVEVVDTCGTVSPPAWITTAVYRDVTFANGTWANSSAVQCSCVSWDTTGGLPRQCQPFFETGNDSWSSNASGGLVISLQSSVGSSEATGYIQLKCEGQAP